ncbi:hypothetical protein [Microbacterium galbinum]|uniref:hypothetical protein n=1 Tax=Microbacterium galbinum TaxID=2851646 RepID=UPI001FFCE938|nr:hypothetical protein [Microbacterium galbinum]MCK2031252.1 hypothetical protein [Microbacterium galbinum]
MMPSVVPFQTNVWRITPAEFAGIISDAERHLTSGSDSANPSAFSVRWVAKTKQGREDHPEGTAEEVVSTIEIPRTHVHIGARLTLNERMIRVTLTQRTVEVMLQSTDQDWLRLTEPWARETVNRFRPGWAWLTQARGLVAFVIAAFIVNYGIYFGMNALISDTLPAVLASLISQAALLAVYISFIARARVILGERGPSRFRAFGVQALLLVIGAVLGVLGQRLFDSIFPPA